MTQPQKLRPDQRDALTIVLEDELLRWAQEAAELRLFREWKESETLEEREKLHAECLALGKVTSKLRKFAESTGDTDDVRD